ncbi:MAG: hypothetical protein K2J88_00015 [Oscillospiraceae bacterium]|nr:hypothetical protein [Oscillospiraceae bacterium]
MKFKKIMLGMICFVLLSMTACGNDSNSANVSENTEIITEQITEPMTTVKKTTSATTFQEIKTKTNNTVSNADSESYYCMGKNDTCPNKTYDPYDFYCSSCDPDNDNIEG